MEWKYPERAIVFSVKRPVKRLVGICLLGKGL
jgi:hypothetical protein